MTARLRASMLPLLSALAMLAAGGCVVDETDVFIRPNGTGFVRRVVTPTPGYAAVFQRKYDRVVGFRTLRDEANAERARWGQHVTVDRTEIVRDDAGQATRVIAHFAFENIHGLTIPVPAVQGTVVATAHFGGGRLELRYPADNPAARPREADIRERENIQRVQYREHPEYYPGSRTRLSLYFPSGYRGSDATHPDANGRRIALYDVRTGEAARLAAEQPGWLRQFMIASTRREKNALLAEIEGTRIENKPIVAITLGP